MTVDRLADRFVEARAVADAVLYEGYVLYPYRASSRKNQVRFQFGVLAPRSYVEQSGTEAWQMRAEYLVQAGRSNLQMTQLHVRVRCLQVQSRSVDRLLSDGSYVAAGEMDLGGRFVTSWDETVEHELAAPPAFVDDLLAFGANTTDLSLGEGSDEEELLDDDGVPAGRIVRTRWPVVGTMTTEALAVGDGLVRVGTEVANLTPLAGLSAGSSREEVVRRSFVAVHILVSVDGASFVSLLDPPQHAAAAVKECRSRGCFPVLCGSPANDTVLCSPIILYDHPEVASESPGDMYDATEIDEILALRTLTLTEEEKREARATDVRSAAIIDRVDAMSPETFAQLHGTIRSLRSLEAETPSRDPGDNIVVIGRHDVGKGSRVRLHPGRHADAQDMFLAGKAATVAGVYNDFDGEFHIAVTVDDDPGAELNEWYGRYRYFRPEEIEVLEVRT